jgi:hypothetical protein
LLRSWSTRETIIESVDDDFISRDHITTVSEQAPSRQLWEKALVAAFRAAPDFTCD